MTSFPTITGHDWLTKCFRPFRAAGGVEANVAWRQIREKLLIGHRTDGDRSGERLINAASPESPQGSGTAIKRVQLPLRPTKLSHLGAPADGDGHTVASVNGGAGINSK